MPARRCSTCSINYPTNRGILKCEVCGDPADWMVNLEPDEDWAQKVARAKRVEEDRGSLSTTEGQIVAWRFGQLVEAGYAPADAERLAHRYFGPERVDLHKAIELVKSGCDPETAGRILL